MPNQTNPNAVAALERIIQEIRYLVDHPRIQQRTWVASGKTWLPLLQIIHGELTGHSETLPTSTSSETEETLLVKVNMSADETYVQIKLEDVDRIQVNRVRGSSSVTLKNGQQFLTSANEAQRLVDVMRQRDEATGNEQK
ncbi:MAG: hypothetical protein IPO91_04425 [Chloroflexi bacterium]|nr:hypothetical protein [Chloroflexota bacterium]